jgi:hypothetical protein
MVALPHPEGRFKPDWVLAFSLAVAFLSCLHGITVRYSHPDQMAFLPLFHEGKMPFNPGWFEKPPFHTYFNYFLSVLPLSAVTALLGIPAHSLATIQLVWSRILATLMFLGSIALVFRIADETYGLRAARIIALLLATSAGLVASSHFLTADIPVMFWMLVAFYFCWKLYSDGLAIHYGLAGLFTGIAMATKYNGLGIGIAIPAAHFLRILYFEGRAFARNPIHAKLVLGLVAVAVGFVMANPFAILDHRTFRSDFLYNYMVAPVYEGQTGHSYFRFFSAMHELIGVPSLLLALAGAIVSLYVVLRSQEIRSPRVMFWLSFVVVAVYYAEFAPFPRLETRFVLPLAPFFFLLSGPALVRLSYARVLHVAIVLLVVYNVLCCYYVGIQFLGDPRIDAELWIDANAVPGKIIESDVYSPDVDMVSHPGSMQVTMPFVTGRERLFERLFPGNTFINGPPDVRTRTDRMVSWYSVESLVQRNPDYLIVNSLYYERFTQPGIRGDLYPTIRDYFQSLLDEEYGYEIVLDRESVEVPALLYPQEIDFLHNRVTILKKRDGLR